VNQAVRGGCARGLRDPRPGTASTTSGEVALAVDETNHEALAQGFISAGEEGAAEVGIAKDADGKEEQGEDRKRRRATRVHGSARNDRSWNDGWSAGFALSPWTQFLSNFSVTARFPTDQKNPKAASVTGTKTKA
jgi:hypothetical protein